MTCGEGCTFGRAGGRLTAGTGGGGLGGFRWTSPGGAGFGGLDRDGIHGALHEVFP
jgi:hypothetical protein